MRRFACLLSGVCLLLSFESPTKAQQRIASNTPRHRVEDSASAGSSSSNREVAASAQYKIGPQDVLRIDVWKEEQLSRTVPVRPDGQITLPLLNDVQAVGLAPMELASAISEKLKDYITNPQVTVTITEINSRRIYVTGEVARSGAFLMLPNMTVLQALSSSGGFTQFAKTKKIYVLRMDAGEQQKLPFNYNEVVKGKKPEQDFILHPGDVIVVP
jgi:polysaccharide export outer membrane protein